MRSVTHLVCLAALSCGALLGDTLYVTNQNSNPPGGANSYISAYSLPSYAFLGNLSATPPFALPGAAVTVDPSGNIYVADAGADRAVEFNSSFQQTAIYNTQPLGYTLVSPSGIAADPAGNIYVSNLDGTIQKISGGVVTTIGNVNNAVARGIAYDPYNGLLYISTQYPGDIYTMSTSGGAATLFASNIGSNNLRGLAFGNGNLYVSDTDTNHVGAIYEFVGNSDMPGLFASNQAGPNSIAVDAQGNLYIAEFYGGDVDKISASGVNLGPVISGQMGPGGIAIGQSLGPEPASWSLFAFAILLVPFFLGKLRKA